MTLTRTQGQAQTSAALRREFSLETWRIAGFAPGQGEAQGAMLPDFDDAGWIAATGAPDVHAALLAAARITDPFFDRAEADCAWVEGREWWYRASFDGGAPLAADERWRLIFHGLDTFATLYVNGEYVGEHRNMFRAAEFEVSGLIRPGAENLIALRFDPPLERVDALSLPRWGELTEPRVGMRKAQYGYGWDWGPRLPTVGLWQRAELRRECRATIAGVHARTVHLAADHSSATLAVRVEASEFSGGAPEATLTARLTLSAPDGRRWTRTVPVREARAEAEFVIDAPELWWTHDLGDPALHDLEIVLSADNATLERHRSRVGLRALELDTSADPSEPGAHFFRFVLNGVPVFARGANWIPADSLLSRLTPERYAALVAAAARANMNMLRVWGGGVYEPEAFYDACDARGILVWQDFMFACAPYPETPELAREVELEARFQVRRLRSRACLALWCGNNENQWLHDTRFWWRGGEAPPGALYYDYTLPRAVLEEDGLTPYWPGSPFGGNDHNSMLEGDRHNWDVWHGNRPFERHFGEEPRLEQTPDGVDYHHYARDRARFVSEFGLHAAPNMALLERYTPPDQLFLHSGSLDHRNKDRPKNKGDNLMLNVTGLPEDLAAYVQYSQIAQAEGLKFALEHYRRRAPHCSGALVWQLNDCWPALSWSLIDYEGGEKAAYHFVRRAYARALLSFKALEDGSVELWVSNSARTAIADTLHLTHRRFDGAPIFARSLEVNLGALESRAVLRLEASALRADGSAYLHARALGESAPSNRHFFAAIKDLRLPPVELQRVAVPGGAEITALGGYAYLVRLSGTPPETDNCFDLEPGETRFVPLADASALPGATCHNLRPLATDPNEVNP